jgi:surface protein
MSDDERKPAARRTKRAKLEAEGQASPPAASVEFNDLPGEIKNQFLGFLDVKTLCIHREVSREWKQNCEQAIEDKKKEGAGVFRTNKELREAVEAFYSCKYQKYTIALAEKVCREYGWVIGRWNVSAVANFSQVFYDKHRFNDPIGDWSVGNGTNFYEMFYYCHAFDQDLSKWSMGKATSLERMFCGCSDFNQDLPWDVANVKNMCGMFSDASSFNGNISTWSTVNVVNAQALFYKAAAFNQDISRWPMANCTKMNYMFKGASSFNQNLETWSTENVTTMRSMFYGATAFRQNLSAWQISNVSDMAEMFSRSGVTEDYVASWEGWEDADENMFMFLS